MKNEIKTEIDGFEIEEIVREAFDIKDDMPTPEILNIEYNHLIDFTKFIVTSVIESTSERFKKDLKENKKKWLN